MRKGVVCHKCNAHVVPSGLWRMGIEVVFKCPECKTRFRTGHIVGAVISALSLTLTLVIVNLIAWIFSSITIPIAVILILPIWRIIGYNARIWWVRMKYNKKS